MVGADDGTAVDPELLTDCVTELFPALPGPTTVSITRVSYSRLSTTTCRCGPLALLGLSSLASNASTTRNAATANSTTVSRSGPEAARLDRGRAIGRVD